MTELEWIGGLVADAVGARTRALRARTPSLHGAARAGPRLHAVRRADELDGQLLRPPAHLDRPRATAPTSPAPTAATASWTPTSATRARSAVSIPSRWCAPCKERVANGSQFMLPTEDAIVVARSSRAARLPAWQFTLSASQANTEALRLARHATGQRNLTFTGNRRPRRRDAHRLRRRGQALVSRPLFTRRPQHRHRPVQRPGHVGRRTGGRDYACVFTEPALTNEGVVMPDPGSTTSCVACAPRRERYCCWTNPYAHLRPRRPDAGVGPQADMVGIGKAVGGGLPLGSTA